MDYEKAVISRILHTGEIKEIMDRKIHKEMFVDERNRKVFVFVLDYFKKYGELPIIEVIDREFPDYQVNHVKEPVSYCIDKVVEKYVRNKGTDIILKNTNNLVASPMEGLDTLRNSFNSLTIEAQPTDDSNIMESTARRREYYFRMKEMKGLDGYPTGWEPLDKATMGWHSEEFVVIVSRTSVGKTWMLLLMAEYAWRNGLTVLFVSNEMSTNHIERRFDAIHFKLPYQEFREGLMADAHEQRYLQGLDDLSVEDRAPMITVGNIGGPSSIASKIDQYKPDIVCVDGMYLLADDRRGSNKWERTSNISWDLKQLTTKKKIPIIATTQFNREAEATKFSEVNLSMLGFSDSIAQDASAVIGLFKDKDMELHKEMYVRMLKVREGESKDFTIRWDLHSMDFGVIHEDDSDQVIKDGELEDDELDY